MALVKEDKDELRFHLEILIKSLEEAPVDFEGTADYDTTHEANAWEVKWRKSAMKLTEMIKYL